MEIDLTARIVNPFDCHDDYQRGMFSVGFLDIDCGVSQDSQLHTSHDRDIPDHWNSTQQVTIYKAWFEGEEIELTPEQVETLSNFICQETF